MSSFDKAEKKHSKKVKKKKENPYGYLKGTQSLSYVITSIIPQVMLKQVATDDLYIFLRTWDLRTYVVFYVVLFLVVFSKSVHLHVIQTK